MTYSYKIDVCSEHNLNFPFFPLIVLLRLENENEEVREHLMLPLIPHSSL